MSIHSEQDLKMLKDAGRIVRTVLRELAILVRPGITTAELDETGAKLLAQHGARSAPRLVYNFPGSLCICVNDEVVHGVPGARIIQAGDLVKLDLTAEKDGYMADACVTVPVPPVSETARRLVECAEHAFHKAMEVARAYRRLWEIGMVVEGEVKRNGFSVVRELCGHGIGRTIHEEPSVPNYADPSLRRRLTEGLVITVEPIIAAGSGKQILDPDGWTVRTADKSLAAHYEHTIVITRGAPLLVTAA